MKKAVFIFVLFTLPLFLYADSTYVNTLVQQKIVYRSSKVGEMFLVWAVNDTIIPEKKLWPPDSYLKNEMVYTKMKGEADSFYVTLSLPVDSKIKYLFFVSEDNKGKKVSGWDSYYNMNYISVFQQNKTIDFKDTALYIPGFTIDILKHGSSILLLSAAFLLCSFYYSGRKLKANRNIYFSGQLLACLAVMIVIRMQMNNMFTGRYRIIPGVVFQDLLCLSIIGVLYFSLAAIARKNVKASKAIFISASGILLLTILFSLFNIKIVEQIGRPLNYQWLYYSDFMQGIDAKNAVLTNLSAKLITNLLLIVCSSFFIGLSFSLILSRLDTMKKTVFVLIPLCLFMILSTWQYRAAKFSAATTDNPIISLVKSFSSSDQEMQLFSMDIPASAKDIIGQMHNGQTSSAAFDSAGLIKNIVVFVMESTPRNLIGVYDSTFAVTPNLKKWRSISKVYNNMFAHIPSTPNSMFSLVSGVYPMLSYKSALIEYPNIDIPSLPEELHKRGWKSSLFFSSDLDYSGMDGYVKQQGFEIVADMKTIACEQNNLNHSHSVIDGLKDDCLINRYFDWYNTSSSSKHLSVLWTNQTHYPYFVSGQTKSNKTENEELNRYLEALRDGDKAFGLLMDGLQKRSLLESTMVIVIADHGEAFGTHNQTKHASKIYDENVHIPCIIYNPVLFHGTSDDQVRGMVDIAPTICHVVGASKPKEWQGMSLLQQKAQDRTFFISPYSDFLFGTVSGDWKYIYNAATNEGELYNLKNDPKELNNLAPLFAEKVESEHRYIGAWVQYHNKHLSALLK